MNLNANFNLYDGANQQIGVGKREEGLYHASVTDNISKEKIFIKMKTSLFNAIIKKIIIMDSDRNNIGIVKGRMRFIWKSRFPPIPTPIMRFEISDETPFAVIESIPMKVNNYLIKDRNDNQIGQIIQNKGDFIGREYEIKYQNYTISDLERKILIGFAVLIGYYNG